jgi:hypothetical protein
VLFSQLIKHNNLPLPPPGERGRGEGAKKPASPSLTLQGHRESSTLVHCPCGAWLGRFTPPPYPSPLPGERGPVLFSQPIKHNNLPSPPPGERGGGEGAKKPASPSSTLQGHRESSTLVHCPCDAWLGRFTPHPLPLSPSRGGGPDADSGRKSTPLGCRDAACPDLLCSQERWQLSQFSISQITCSTDCRAV